MIRMSRTADRVKITFALPLEGPAGRCSVVGDFNEWIPGSHELRKRANGTRSATVTVPRGTRLRFRYLGEDGNVVQRPRRGAPRRRRQRGGRLSGCRDACRPRFRNAL